MSQPAQNRPSKLPSIPWRALPATTMPGALSLIQPTSGSISAPTGTPRFRTVHLGKLDFSCGAPILVQDIHANLAGDVSADFVPYSHRAGVEHTLSFLDGYTRLEYPPFMVEVLLRGMASFPCRRDAPIGQAGAPPALEEGNLLLPPHVLWAGLAIFYWVWPVWVLLTALSLAYVIWKMAQGEPAPWGKQLTWIAVVIFLGPFGFLAYLLAYRTPPRSRCSRVSTNYTRSLYPRLLAGIDLFGRQPGQAGFQRQNR